MSKKIYYLLLVLIFLIQFFYYQPTLTQIWDYQYFQDLYDHSQWTLAKATRGISDSSLYQIAGYQLVTKEKIFSINPEVPPLGKYFYGWSILLFSNPYYASLLWYLTTVYLFFLLTDHLVKKSKANYLIKFIFLLEPIVFSQVKQTMMDLPQLTFLLLHTLSIEALLKTKKEKTKILSLITAGLSLGGFISLKIGVLGLLIFLVDLLFFSLNRQVSKIIPIAILSLSVYLFCYLPFFWQGNSLISYLKNQKWMFQFYFSSSTKPFYFMPMISMLTGFYNGWFGNGWSRVNEWTIFWPIYCLTLLSTVFQLIKGHSFKKIDFALWLKILTSVIFLFFCFIPFWNRYLLLLIPFLILEVFQKPLPKKALLAFFLIFFTQIWFFFKPTPQLTLAAIEKEWNKGNYQELYNYLDSKSKQKISRNQFVRTYQIFENEIGLTKREVKIDSVFAFPWQSQSQTNLKIVYETSIGSLVNQKPLTLLRNHDNWQLVWQNNFIFSDFQYKNYYQLTTETGYFGTITDASGNILSKMGKRPFFSLLPKQIKNEEKAIKQLTFLTGLTKPDLEVLYKANNQVDLLVDIGYLCDELPSSLLNNYPIDPGIIVQEKTTRIYSDNLYQKGLVLKTKKEIAKYFLQANPESGGQISVKFENGSSAILLKVKTKNGRDVIIKK